MKKKPERWIALSVIISATALIVGLGLVLGKFHLPNSERILKVNFPSVTGISLNSPVKYAGAQVGRVQGIRVLGRKEALYVDHTLYCIQVELAIDPKLELGDDVKVSIKQDGLLGSRFVALIPGSLDSVALDETKVRLGEDALQLDDLMPLAQSLVVSLQPTLEHLHSITEKVDAQLPGVLTQLDTLMNGTSGLIGSVDTPEGREHIRKLVRNLAVISDNLKVITTEAKGITATLGAKPWRMIWGGVPTKLPTEAQILEADRPLPIDGDYSPAKPKSN